MAQKQILVGFPSAIMFLMQDSYIKILELTSLQTCFNDVSFCIGSFVFFVFFVRYYTNKANLLGAMKFFSDE
jgi:hypothetical protein